LDPVAPGSPVCSPSRSAAEPAPTPPCSSKSATSCATR
jgi:hypothetical protein